jgi:hypothetical protein
MSSEGEEIGGGAFGWVEVCPSPHVFLPLFKPQKGSLILWHKEWKKWKKMWGKKAQKGRRTQKSQTKYAEGTNAIY